MLTRLRRAKVTRRRNSWIAGRKDHLHYMVLVRQCFTYNVFTCSYHRLCTLVYAGSRGAFLDGLSLPTGSINRHTHSQLLLSLDLSSVRCSGCSAYHKTLSIQNARMQGKSLYTFKPCQPQVQCQCMSLDLYSNCTNYFIQLCM